MTDIAAPNENGYFVYSEHDREKASELVDKHNRIDRADIPLSTYAVFRCPECGRLMVFGKANRSLSYRPEFEPEEADSILNGDE